MSSRETQPRVRRERRDVHGILLLDKPHGLSSNAALQAVKWLYAARKAGHGGSLDPLATGLLPCLFGEATKVSGLLLDAGKRYRFTAKLGVTTTTGDAEGALLAERPLPPIDADVLEAVFARFRGPIEQVPPMHSALKRDGRPLYELARQGIEVERAPRSVTIHSLQLLDWSAGSFSAEVACSKGTYIRVLAEDIGAALGCGAHLLELRRIGVEPWDAARMLTLDQLRALGEDRDALDACLLPIDSALAGWPRVELGDEAAHGFVNGNPVRANPLPVDGEVRVYGNGRLLGIGCPTGDGRVAPRRVLNAS